MALTLLVFGVLGLPMIMAAGALIWGGISLLIEAWHCQHPRPEVLERFARFQPPSSLGDEAERWLQSQW